MSSQRGRRLSPRLIALEQDCERVLQGGCRYRCYAGTVSSGGGPLRARRFGQPWVGPHAVQRQGVLPQGGTLLARFWRTSFPSRTSSSFNCVRPYQDVVSTKRAIENYSNADATFPSTREAKFLVAITDAFDSGDAETFTGAVAEYDRYGIISRGRVLALADRASRRLTKLDNWKTGILLAIKKSIAEEPGLV